MEPYSAPSATLSTTMASEHRHRTGAMGARTAVAFREEKLARKNESFDTSDSTSTPLAQAKLSKRPTLASNVPLIVHSHLRWDFVWQRPQQLLSRFAKTQPVMFVEDPVEAGTEATLDISLTREGVVRVVPNLPNAGASSVDEQCAVVLPLLNRALAENPLLKGRFNSPVQWFYSPMTAPLYCGEFGAIGVVYDCMDELSGFRFAPDDIAERESYLLSNADVVFTGGYELYRAKAARHANTHFFGCGVDVAHFSCARARETVVPADVAAIPGPILGYYGVIDERLDYELIARLSARFPDASIVMVGPLAKVREEDLPRAANIHWLGSRNYADLPAIVKGFDVCLMPFALNAATQFINPTKTLEYLATGKPVVSSAVPDVVRQYNDIVEVAHSVDEFGVRVAKVLGKVDSERTIKGISLALASSWESTVAAMREHIRRTLAASTPSLHNTVASNSEFVAETESS